MVCRRGSRETIRDSSAQRLRRLLQRRRSQPGRETRTPAQLKLRAPRTPGRAIIRRHRNMDV